MGGVELLEHHEIFEILSEIEQECSEFYSLDEVLGDIRLAFMDVFGGIESSEHGGFTAVNDQSRFALIIVVFIDFSETHVAVAVEVNALPHVGSLGFFGVALSHREELDQFVPMDIGEFDVTYKTLLLIFLFHSQAFLVVAVDLGLGRVVGVLF